MSNGNPIDESKKVEQFLSFPVLTREVGTPVPGRNGTPSSAGGGAPIAQLVESALRDVLGWRPRAGDARGFIAALNQSFTCQEFEGRMQCTWTPRSYAVSVQANLGTITGAQASLYSRARNTSDQVLPLLDGLRPLRTDPDPEDTAATRAIVRSALVELVNELGTFGGPRAPRVDDLFTQLLGPEPREADPGSIGGHLQILRDRFGLTRSSINTVEEEQNYTNFLLVLDYIHSLEQGWIAQRSLFNRSSGEAFLGTQLVLLSRELAAIAESVQELNALMDSYFLGAAERETVLLQLGDPANPTILTVAELFGWIERFVSEEAPRLIQDGGRDGVAALRSTLALLTGLVQDLLVLSRTGGNNPHPVIHHDFFATGLTAKLLHMTTALELIDALKPIPAEKLEVTSFSERFGTAGDDVENAKVRGSGFVPDIWVSLGRGIRVHDVQQLTGEELAVDFRSTPTARGVKHLTVVTDDGEVAILRDAFTITSSSHAPRIVGVKGSAGRLGQRVQVEIETEPAFGSTPAASLEGASDTIAAVRVQTLSSTRLIAHFDLGSAPAHEGLWNIVVRTNGGVFGVVNGFTILPAAVAKPLITRVLRRSSSQSNILELTLLGSGFHSSSAVVFGSGLRVVSTSATQSRITASVRVLPQARGTKPAVVINPDGQLAVYVGAFKVLASEEGRDILVSDIDNDIGDAPPLQQSLARGATPQVAQVEPTSEPLDAQPPRKPRGGAKS